MASINRVQQQPLFGGAMPFGYANQGMYAAPSMWGYGGMQQPSAARAFGVGGPFCPSQILPNLYLGTYGDALNITGLQGLGITKVLNVANDCPPPAGQYRQANIQFLHLQIGDEDSVQIAGFVAQAIPWLHQALSANEKVLVHCRMGRSRSAMIVIAYLMKYGADGNSAMSYAEAERFVRARRPEVNPNPGFTRQLQMMDTKFHQQQGQLPQAGIFGGAAPFGFGGCGFGVPTPSVYGAGFGGFNGVYGGGFANPRLRAAGY